MTAEDTDPIHDEFLIVAGVLKLNKQTIRNWIDDGQLPAIRIGRRVRIRREDLDRLLNQPASRPAPRAPVIPAPVAFGMGTTYRS